MESEKKRNHPGDSESEGAKRTRLEKRNERDRARRRAETDAEKTVRLARRRDRDRARREEATTEALLKHKSALQQQRLAAETPEKRAVRLKHQQQSLNAETPEKRAARLEHSKCPEYRGALISGVQIRGSSLYFC